MQKLNDFDAVAAAAAALSLSPTSEASTQASPAIPEPNEAFLNNDDARSKSVSLRANFKFPEYAGTKKEHAPTAEKELLLQARRQREHALKLKRRIDTANLTTQTTSERQSLAWSPSEGRPADAVAISALKRPFGVYSARQVYCGCAACQENRELDLKGDYYWGHGDAERALRLTHKQCLMTLPPQFNRLPLRVCKRREPKGIDWVSPLQKKLPAAETVDSIFEKDTQTAAQKLAQFKRWGSVKLEGFEEVEQQIAMMELEIRRLSGSASWTAEVIVIVSSLRVEPIAFLTSFRMTRFLESKGVEHFTIDINSDIGGDHLDIQLIKTLDEHDCVLRNPRKVAYEAAIKALTPQLLVDGVPIGSLEEVMSLEDDGDLDYILSREACPNCLCDRKADWKHCRRCGAKFYEIVSEQFLTREQMKILADRAEENCVRMKAPTPHHWERRRRHLGLKREDEDVSAWFDPEEIAKYGQPSVGFSIEFGNNKSQLKQY